MTYLITDKDGHFVNWSDHPLTGDGLFSRRICDRCAFYGVPWWDAGQAQVSVYGCENELFCVPCRGELLAQVERRALQLMRITTAKGSNFGTLDECWIWQEKHQGAFATLILGDGMSVDIADCDTLDEVRAAIAAARK